MNLPMKENTTQEILKERCANQITKRYDMS